MPRGRKARSAARRFLIRVGATVALVALAALFMLAAYELPAIENWALRPGP